MLYRHRIKDVYVRQYVRMRFGKLESVCQHYRSRPYQYVLFVVATT